MCYMTRTYTIVLMKKIKPCNSLKYRISVKVWNTKVTLACYSTARNIVLSQDPHKCGYSSNQIKLRTKKTHKEKLLMKLQFPPT